MAGLIREVTSPTPPAAQSDDHPGPAAACDSGEDSARPRAVTDLAAGRLSTVRPPGCSKGSERLTGPAGRLSTPECAQLLGH